MLFAHKPSQRPLLFRVILTYVGYERRFPERTSRLEDNKQLRSELFR